MPTLERGGKRGGGRNHNSVKTGIFEIQLVYVYSARGSVGCRVGFSSDASFRLPSLT